VRVGLPIQPIDYNQLTSAQLSLMLQAVLLRFPTWKVSERLSSMVFYRPKLNM
jgi:hypothetical protein